MIPGKCGELLPYEEAKASHGPTAAQYVIECGEPATLFYLAEREPDGRAVILGRCGRHRMIIDPGSASGVSYHIWLDGCRHSLRDLPYGEAVAMDVHGS